MIVSDAADMRRRVAVALAAAAVLVGGGTAGVGALAGWWDGEQAAPGTLMLVVVGPAGEPLTATYTCVDGGSITLQGDRVCWDESVGESTGWRKSEQSQNAWTKTVAYMPGTSVQLRPRSLGGCVIMDGAANVLDTSAGIGNCYAVAR